jgi:hypothetical protein
MPDELPIACSLSGSDLKQRLAEMADLGRVALVDHQSADGKAVLRFRSSEETSQRLGRIVAAEAECCAFLDLGITARGDSLELTIAGPDGAEPVVDELVEAFAGQAGAPA